MPHMSTTAPHRPRYCAPGPAAGDEQRHPNPSPRENYHPPFPTHTRATRPVYSQRISGRERDSRNPLRVAGARLRPRGRPPRIQPQLHLL